MHIKLTQVCRPKRIDLNVDAYQNSEKGADQNLYTLIKMHFKTQRKVQTKTCIPR